MTLCANCFEDHGLHLMAVSGSQKSESPCPACGKSGYEPLNKEGLLKLSDSFFVRGSFFRSKFGGAPAIQFNDLQEGSLAAEGALQRDVDRLQRELEIGFFHYGPRMWMLGHITPLLELQEESSRPDIIAEIIRRYPAFIYEPDRIFYRLRNNPERPTDASEFDAPPPAMAGRGRLDASNSPVLYGSEDLELCVHECRVTVEDETYVASLSPTGALRLLDLTALLEETKSEFESLDLTVHMLFLAGAHAYPITREIAAAAAAAGYDGVIYPSFYSLLRTGGAQMETVYGISARRIPQLFDVERRKIIPNVAFFGRPVEKELIAVKNINRLVVHEVRYGLILGPVLPN